MTQTTDGYLWIGTDRGLVRFDGLTFRAFSHAGPNHTAIESVFALAGDRRGNLLVSTLLGIQRLHLRNEELEELPPVAGQPSDPVAGVYPQRDGTILIATVRRGMIAYDGANFTPMQGTRSDVTAAVRARDGAVWTGTATQGLFGYFNRRLLDPSRNLHHVRITALLPFREHGLWVGTDKGVLQWDGANSQGSAFGPAHIEAMLEDRQGILWLGSAEGLYHLGSDGASTAAVPYSRDIVTSLYEDREGDVWAGTSTGILRLRRRVLATYLLGPDGKEQGGPLFADSRGVVWCANPDRGIVRIVDGRIESFIKAGGYTSLAISGTNLWLGQQDGTLVRATITASTASVSLKETRQLGHPIIAISPNREGRLWIGMQNAGVAEIDGGHTTFQSNADGFELNTVTAIEQGRDGTMWFATANGVASELQGRWHSYTAQDGVPPGRINCLFATETGELWVGADQGLAYIVNGTAHIPASNLPLLRESILGIAVDRDDFLWIRTSNHILRVRRAELVSSRGSSISVRQFGVDDGLPAVPPIRTSRSLTADAEGRIWMALGNTLAMADPGFLYPSPPTLIQLQGVEADEHPLSWSEKVLVPAGHRRTVIRFAGLNLGAPDRVRYRYRLSGFDRDWGEPTSMREATYTNLVPGSYRFEVQASNTDGQWNGPIATLAVYLEPAPWQTFWFRSAVVLTICAIGLAVFRLRMRAAKRQWNVRFQERLDERTRIARDLHDTLLQSFHGLLLRFQAARDMLPGEPDAAGHALDSAIDRAAAAITEGRDAVQALRGDDEDDELGESLATIDREFRKEVRAPQQSPPETSYRVLVEGTPRRLHPVVRDDLYRIAREAVRNAFRHARAQQIELDIRYDDGVFRLRVRDDGGGVDPKILSSGQRKGHYGLPGMRERAVNIGGQFEIWSELRRGTEIEVTIPGAIAYVRFEDTGNAVLE